MELDLDTKQILSDLIEKPETVSQAHANLLNNLILKYPYYQPLYLLLAKAHINERNSEVLNNKAAFYNGGLLLHKIIYHPINLTNEFLNKNHENISPSENEEVEVFEEISDVAVPNLENNANTTLQNDEVYEEIVEIDPIDFPSSVVKGSIEVEEELVIENIVATDFFAFEESLTIDHPTEILNKKEVITQPEEYNLEAEAQTISKYNDDKLPYTFLWWLAKTRKEHEQIFQPYVTQKKTEPSQTGELQQQYVEHIFHIQSPFNEKDENNKGPVNRKIIPKGIDIIDSFIKNDPQIKAPKPEQINTENKAKKSAEDHNDLVSETLAAIYIEQMLYHKAIDTYEKLSLKFPEKSRYFADLIQSLEKKI